MLRRVAETIGERSMWGNINKVIESCEEISPENKGVSSLLTWNM